MKKSILAGIGALLFGAFMLTACSSGSEKEAHDHATDHAKEKVYYCPMHCEGDKTYAEPGNCPVCGMELVEEK